MDMPPTREDHRLTRQICHFGLKESLGSHIGGHSAFQKILWSAVFQTRRIFFFFLIDRGMGKLVKIVCALSLRLTLHKNKVKYVKIIKKN